MTISTPGLRGLCTLDTRGKGQKVREYGRLHHTDVSFFLVLCSYTYTITHMHMKEYPLHEAIEAIEPNYADVTQLVRSGYDVNTIRTNRYMLPAPLHVAAEHGHKKIAEFLLEKKANVNISNRDRETPLHTAAQYGRTDIVEVLLGAAADPDLPPNLPSWVHTPLHVAAQYGHTDIVQVLLGAAADPNRPDSSRRTPLHVAVMEEHTDVVQVLLGAAADPNRPDVLQRTPLHVGVLRGHTVTPG